MRGEESNLCLLGTNIDLSESMFSDLGKFICCMHGRPYHTNVNKLRYDMFAQRHQDESGQLLSSYDGVNLSLLPPFRDSLRIHNKRANYQAYI